MACTITRRRVASWCVVCLLAAASAVLAGQDERVPVQPLQKPDRTTHYTTTQDTSLDVTSPDAALPGPIQMRMKMSGEYTQVNGHADEKGGFESRISFDRTTFDATINGMPAPLPSPMDGLAGRAATAVYDAGGKLVEIKGLPEAKALEVMFRQLLGTAAMHDTTLAVGETRTLPLDVALPLPTGGAGGGGAMQGTMTVTLLAIEREGADRMARFSVTIGSTTTTSVPPIEMTIKGTGTMLIDVDGGFIRANDVLVTVDGGMALPGGAGQVKMHGTMKMAVTGHE